MSDKTGRRLMAALFDWDGTLRPGFTILPWCRFLQDKALLKTPLVDHLEQLFASYRASRLTYEELAVQSAVLYAEGTIGIAVDLLNKTAREFILHPASQLYPFAGAVLGLFRSAGIRNIVVSGAPSEVLGAYLAKMPIDEVWGLEVRNEAGRSTVNNRALPREKAEVVDVLRRKFSIEFGFGNGIADLPILEAARVSILINSPPDSFPSSIRKRLLICTEENVESVVRQQLANF